MAQQKVGDEPPEEDSDRRPHDDKQPWHKPRVQRLEIEETASPGSGGGIPGGDP
jgi:hypothetical protein